MTNKPSSAVCYAAEASGIYMGYADRDEVLGALNELLEAERAGTWVASFSRREAPLTAYSALMQDVGRDEAHWFVMLTRQIQRLGGSPSHQTGAFFAARKSVVSGKSVSVRVDLGCRRIIKKKKKQL